jgi:nitroimidazol reductase NimA-like FMN-containing flavoprotein (pyridoxamine 5'-phosphate oxidase superfamily)
MKHKINIKLEEIEEIIAKCEVCNLSMVDNNGLPYVVPMNFGYQNNTIYFHGAPKGKKFDILKNNPKVCISFSTDHELRYQNEKVACSWSMKYRSVIAYGKVKFIDESEKKIEALNIVMKNYTDKEFKYSPPSIREVSVFKVEVDKMDGRVYGY